MALPKCECGKPITLCDRLNCLQSTFIQNPPPMANEPTISEMNKVIAEFMGASEKNGFIEIPGRPYSISSRNYPKNLRYNIYWDWLMPVVEKIEDLEGSRFGFTIDALHVVVTDYKGKGVEIIWVHKFPDNDDTKISMTYDAVYQFITWYNQQKQKDGTE